MGNGSTKEGIIQRLDELDVEEIKINIKLKKLQCKLNAIVPEEEKMEVNKDLANETIEIDKLRKQPLEERSDSEEEESEEEEDEEKERRQRKKKKKHNKRRICN